jgi:hypothetical protein
MEMTSLSRSPLDSSAESSSAADGSPNAEPRAHGVSATLADISGWLGIDRGDAIERGSKNGRFADDLNFSVFEARDSQRPKSCA